MSYNVNVPKTGNSGSQDYTDMQLNFLEIQTAFSVNHLPLASSSNDGYHTKVFLAAPLGSDPNLTAPISSVYSKGSPPQLFFQNGSLAANVDQLTGNLVTESASQYTVVTPWGIIFKFGIMDIVSSGSQVNFTTQFPNTGLGCTITIRQSTGSGFSTAAQISQTGITLVGGSINGQTAYFFAWGN